MLVKLTTTERSRLQCPECPKTFSLKQKLRNHQMLKHLGQKPFSCHICDKGFVQKQSLSAHMGSVHDQGKAESCKFCSKPFFDQSYLKKHLRWHQKIQESKQKQ